MNPLIQWRGWKCNLVLLVWGLLTAGTFGKEPIRFEGNLFDFLVYLGAQYQIEVGLDPLLMREAPLRTVSLYEQRNQESTAEFLTRIARTNGFSVQPLGTYYYFTTKDQQNLQLLAAFESRKFQDCIAIAAKQQASTSVQAAKDLAQLILTTKGEAASRAKRIADFAGQYRAFATRGSFVGSQRMGLSLDANRGVPPGSEAERYKEKAISAHRAVVDLCSDGLADLGKAVKRPREFNAAISSVPRDLISILWLEFTLEACDNCLNNLSSVKQMVKDAGTVEEEILRFRTKIEIPLRGARQESLEAGQLYSDAYKLWESKQYADAFSLMSALQGLGDGTNGRYRLGYGMLAIKTKIEAIRNLPQATARIGNLINTVNDPRLCPAGMTAEIANAVGKHLRTDLKFSDGGVPRHPGRIGTVDGLAVRASTGKGVASPKAVQLLKKLTRSEQSTRTKATSTTQPRDLKSLDMLLPTESPDDQIEIHGMQVALDEYTIASIKDSLRYICKSKVPDLFEKNRLSIVFDDSVHISQGGDSAGAAFALAALSAVKSICPEPGICVTGAIRPYGDISPVGGIYPKSTAGADEGYKIILMPEQNCMELRVLDFSKLGPLQVILGNSLDDYIDFVLPSLAQHAAQAKWATQLYSMAYLLYKAGDYPVCKSVLQELVKEFPRHFSAEMLLAQLRLAGVRDTPIPDELNSIIKQMAGR